jgi:hypothetical protein
VSEAFLLLRRTERGMIRNVCWTSCKVTVILVIETWTLSAGFRKILIKIRPVGADLFYAVRRTDRLEEANVCFYQLRESAYKRIDSLLRNAATSYAHHCISANYVTVINEHSRLHYHYMILYFSAQSFYVLTTKIYCFPQQY